MTTTRPPIIPRTRRPASVGIPNFLARIILKGIQDKLSSHRKEKP